jgi:tetratricopeptide (TPR) repeat protein
MSSNPTESAKTIEWLTWLEVNKWKLVGGAVALVVIGLGYAIYQRLASEAEAAASGALLTAQRQKAQEGGESRPNAQALLQVAAEHHGTAAGGRALLFGAEALFREGKFTEAKNEFDKFIREYGDSTEIASAVFGVAACWDAMTKTNEAVTGYQDVVTRYGNAPVANQAKLALARLYDARNDSAQALKLYDELSRPTAQSAWGPEASMYREQLLQRHPELARTNLPPAAVPSTPLLTNLLQSATNPARAPASGDK